MELLPFDPTGEEVGRLQEHIGAMLLCVPRLVAMGVFIPFMRSPFLPGVVRNVLLFSLAIFVSPMVIANQELPADQIHWVALAAKEVAVGLLMGFAVGMAFTMPQLIGDFIDNQRGTSMAQVFNPAQGGQASIIGTMLSLLVTTLFLSAGGFVLLADLIIDSYRVIGVNEVIPSERLEVIAGVLVGAFAKLLAIGLLLAAPVVLMMMLAEFGLGLMGRFVQQLQVFFLAMPVKSMIGLALIISYIIVILRIYEANDLPLGPLRGMIEALRDA